MHRQNLGEMLVAANLIDQVQMQIALAEQRQTGKRFGSTLVDLQFIDENVLAAFLSKQMDVPCISLLHIDIPKKVLRKMTRFIASGCCSGQWCELSKRATGRRARGERSGRRWNIARRRKWRDPLRPSTHDLRPQFVGGCGFGSCACSFCLASSSRTFSFAAGS